MNVLVTGGTGFLGANLVAALLERGDAVRVLRRASSSLIALDGLRVEHVIGDILEPDAVARAGVPRVVHTSSVAAVGIPPPGTVGDETTPFDALSVTFAYADSKHRAEA